MNFVPLPRAFYEPSAAIVAPLLLGHWLIRRTRNGFCGGPIAETEAYLCENDPACHASVGQTPRNQAMWGEPGHGYVYYIYGNYYCFNAVCLPKGSAEAVLIRAVEVEFGEEQMRSCRSVAKTADLTNGPGKLCLAMEITRKLDGIDLCDADSPLFIAENPAVELIRKEHGPITTTTRVGITKAAHLPLRFYLEKSHFISKRAAGTRLRKKK